MNVESVFQGYVDCALWASVDDGENPLDAEFDSSDIERESLRRMREVVVDFIAQCDKYNLLDGLNAEQVGYDLWLTQNRHGAGFWDRGLGSVGDQLTVIAHGMGSAYLFVDDEGAVYYHG